jgi:outer membrane protein assembly factor BamB
MRGIFFPALLVVFFCICHLTPAGDWPQWRYDTGRGAVTPHALPEMLHLQWTRQLPSASPAWPATQSKLQFDIAPEPVVAGGRLFVPHSTNDSVTAYDTGTGRELWRFYAGAPVRFAPATGKGKVWFVSDDGHLYCLNAASGKLLWKFNGGPAERWVLGHGRMISSWPARGGAVYRDGKVWFTASIWPFMGIFIHCLDAETGHVLWTNSGIGMNYTVQPHGAPSFATVAPQGHLALAGNHLYVPGGRSIPAVFDANTGKLSHFEYDKKHGHYRVYAAGDYYFVDGSRYQASNGKGVESAKPQLLGTDYVIHQNGEGVTAQKLNGRVETRTKTDRRGKKVKESKFVADDLWSAKISSDFGRIFLQAGNRLYTGGKNKLGAFDVATLRGGQSKPAWSAPIKDKPWTMLAADNRLFVVTEESRLYCFGANKIDPKRHAPTKTPLPSPDNKVTARVAPLLNHLQTQEGHALVLGADAEYLDTLLNNTKLRIVSVDSDPAKVDTLRRRYEAAGLYGHRISILQHASPLDFPAPPHFANLVIVNSAVAANLKPGRVQAIYKAVRPYGGILSLDHKNAKLEREIKAIANARMLPAIDGALIVKREGPLPGSADWSHQYADAGQSVVSKDNRVKAPLGLLWFGGPSNAKILPRHGHGPSPQVAGGRLIIEGADVIRALDVYTGRLLWERELKGIGEYYNITGHFPGAGEIGSNYVTLPDAVYVVYGGAILELDVASGRTVKEFKLPKETNFGWLSVRGNYLVTTTSPVAIKLPDKEEKPAAISSLAEVNSRFASGSHKLAVFNRATGKLLWTRDAQFNFRHNNIALGADSVFVIDSLTEARLKALNRRGLTLKGKPALYALNIKTGDALWETNENVFGTFLNYSTEHDLLLQAGSAYRDRAKDDIGQGMVAYRGQDGSVLWANKDLRYNGPCLLLKDRIITNGNGGFALDIKTGIPTGWKYKRNYGCNTAIGSEHLLTFRSGAAGFYDLTNDGGTGNWGGFRSSCTANLIPANGILNAPDYTRTCGCAYQLQTSLALIHMPELEYWTFGTEVPQNQMAINLGAPGDRRGPNGKMWLEYPEVGGPSTKANVTITPKTATTFRLHSTAVQSGDLRWIAASGLEGASRVNIALKENGNYHVKLHFMEPENLKAGQRVFDVALQGKTMLRGLDIAKSAAGIRRAIVKEFTVNIQDQTLRIDLTPQGKKLPVLSGIQWHHKP